MPKLVWTERLAERARELARHGATDRQIVVALGVSRRLLQYHRLGLQALRPPTPTRQAGERSPPTTEWMRRALDRAEKQLKVQIALAKLEATDPNTPRYKGHKNDFR